MEKNLEKMHQLFQDFIDEYQTGRASIRVRDNMINLAITDIVSDRAEQIKVQKPYSIQSGQRVRDELSPILILDYSPTFSSPNIIRPANYYRLTRVKVQVDGVEKEAFPVTEDWLISNRDNPYTKPSDDRVRYIEHSGGIKIIAGSGVLTSPVIDYVKEPKTVDRGETQYDNTVTWTSADDGNRALVVTSATVTYDGTTYNEGESFIIDSSSATSFTGSGEVVILIETDLPASLHEEIVRRAAAIYKGQMGNDQRKQSILSEEFDS